MWTQWREYEEDDDRKSSIVLEKLRKGRVILHLIEHNRSRHRNLYYMSFKIYPLYLRYDSLQILKEYSKDIGTELNDRIIKAVDDDIFKKVEEAESPRSGFKVILHGDLWYSNFMFR